MTYLPDFLTYVMGDMLRTEAVLLVSFVIVLQVKRVIAAAIRRRFSRGSATEA